MLVRDIMHTPVIAVPPSASIAEAARLMLDHDVSGLPVISETGRLAGIVTESDFLRRAELGTEKQRPRWLEYLVSTGKVAEDYVLSHGRRVSEVMQDDPLSCHPDDSLRTVVDIMLHRHIKRLPVVENGRVVGIIARSDLLKALAPLTVSPSVTVPDARIASEIEARMAKEVWPGSLVTPTVNDGVVTLEGTVYDIRQQQALHVLVENVPGVRSVIDHLLWIEPRSGTVLGPTEQDPLWQ